MNWWVIVIAISLFLPTSLKGKCVKDGQCSEANRTCVKLIDGTIHCQPLNRTNHTMDTRWGKVEEQSSDTTGHKKEAKEFGKDMRKGFAYLGMGLVAFVIVVILLVLLGLSCCVGTAVLIYYLVTRNQRARRSHGTQG